MKNRPFQQLSLNGTGFAVFILCNWQTVSFLGGEMIYRVLLGVIVLVLASKHSLGATINPVLVEVPLSKVFVPAGFDTNDRIQFAVGGELRNSCFKVVAPEVKVDLETKTIVVKQQAYVYMGFCLMMIMPYSKVVTLGVIEQPGTYQIVEGRLGRSLGTIEVSLARTIEQDEFLYAPVSDVNIVQASGPNSEEDPQRNKVVLSGSFSNGCTEFKEIRVSQNENTIVVQPITIFKEQMSECKDEKIEFLKTVVLDPKLKGDYLVHVRSLNGAALNKVVDFGG